MAYQVQPAEDAEIPTRGDGEMAALVGDRATAEAPAAWVDAVVMVARDSADSDCEETP